MPAGTAITFDYNGGANQEGYATNRVYAKGANALGATTLNITTDPTGATSVAWTPAFTHAIGSNIYGTTHTPILDLNAIAGFTKSMYDALAPFHAHAYYFTLNDTSVVHTTYTPQWADAPRSLVQTIGGVYTYAPAYYIIANYVWFPAAPVTGTYTAQIGGNTVFVKQGTLGAQNTIGRSSQANFTVFDRLGATLFQQFQQVQILDQNGVLAFSGYLNPPKIQKPGFQPALETQITCIDQHWLALKRIVAKVYRNQTFGFIVQDLVTNILSQEGVTVGTIAAGPIVPFANFGYVTISAALDALVAAASSSGIPHYWSIDQNKQIWAVPYTAIVGAMVGNAQSNYGAGSYGSSSYGIGSGGSIQIDDGQRSGFKPTLTPGNPKFRNTQYAVGGVAQTGTNDETQAGDGQKQAFTFKYPLASAPSLFQLNGVTKTLGTKGQTGFNYYWAQGDPTIAQDSSQTILVSTDRLHMIYIGQFPTVFTNNNATQIAAQALLDGTSGIIESVLTDNTIATAADGLARVNQQLSQYGVSGQLFEFATRTPGFQPGQLITVTYAPLGFAATQMLIAEVDFSDQADGINIWYTVHAVTGPYDVSWVNFFANLLQPATIANNINLGVSLNIGLAPSLTLAPSTTLAPG